MRYLISLLLLSGGLSIATAQSLIVPSLQAEATIRGVQYGGTLIYENNKKLGCGVFYQTQVSKTDGDDNKYVLYGLHVQLPIVHANRLWVFATGRTGLVNDKFVIAVPGFETRIDVLKHYALSLGGSMRMGYPALYYKLSIKLNPHGKK